MMASLHPEIDSKLDTLLADNKIPNIIFHGPAGAGKRILVNKFIKRIYADCEADMNEWVMSVNCAHGKGIKFVRDDIKFFAKTNIGGKPLFKTVLLTNADKLTSDAQSALRRCIELYAHNTRFFIVVENKYKLLRPILSRFCELYIPQPKIRGIRTNLHKHVVSGCFSNETRCAKRIIGKLNERITSCNLDRSSILDLADELYEKGYSASDIIDCVEEMNIPDKKKFQLLIAFRRARSNFRCEQMLMTFVLTFALIRSDYDLENVRFM